MDEDDIGGIFRTVLAEQDPFAPDMRESARALGRRRRVRQRGVAMSGTAAAVIGFAAVAAVAVGHTGGPATSGAGAEAPGVVHPSGQVRTSPAYEPSPTGPPASGSTFSPTTMPPDLSTTPTGAAAVAARIAGYNFDLATLVRLHSTAQLSASDDTRGGTVQPSLGHLLVTDKGAAKSASLTASNVGDAGAQPQVPCGSHRSTLGTYSGCLTEHLADGTTVTTATGAFPDGSKSNLFVSAKTEAGHIRVVTMESFNREAPAKDENQKPAFTDPPLSFAVLQAIATDPVFLALK